MSQLFVDDVVSKEGTNSVGFSKGISVSVASTFSGDVSIGGTLTYEDVTNVDVVGLITARGGIKLGAAGIGGTFNANGDTTLAGVVTATTFVGNLTGDPTGTVQTAAQPNITSVGTLTNLVATASSVTGISSVGLAITMYGSSGIVSATAFYGDGAALSGVVSGIEVESGGTSVGTSLTAINFASGATITQGSSGITTVTIAAGITTYANVASGIVSTLYLSDAQDHKITTTGVVTFTTSGGSEGDSHTLRIINSGVSTVGFSTYFLWPSGSSPVMPTASGAISLISFTVQRVGAGGTQLLAGASLNYS